MPARAWSQAAWAGRINEIRADAPVIEEVVNFDGMGDWEPSLVWQVLFLSAFLAKNLGPVTRA